MQSQMYSQMWSKQFKWPIHSDECWYNSVLSVLNSPTPVNSCGAFKLQPGHFDKFKKFLA